MTENEGKKALPAARKFKPDIIFLDVLMPDLSGGEAARQLAEDNRTREMPIIFLTAVVDKEEVCTRGGLIGGHPFIAKPVTVEQLIDTIEEHLG